MSGYPGPGSESQSEACRLRALQLLEESRKFSDVDEAAVTVAQAQVYATLAISLELSWLAKP